MELPIELRRLIEKYKAQYNIIGTDDEILKKVIPKLEDEDIIRLYDELCEEERRNNMHKNLRPNFEKYREEILDYLDDSIVKSEIIQREQKQSSKPDLDQRNYTYISEFTTTLDNNIDKLKIINSFYRKIRQLKAERNFLDVKEAIRNLELSIHIYECIMHIREKMDIDLVLYRSFKGKKKYKLQNNLDIRKIKHKQREKEEYQKHLQLLCLNQLTIHINNLKKNLQEIKLQEERKSSEEAR